MREHVVEFSVVGSVEDDERIGGVLVKALRKNKDTGKIGRTGQESSVGKLGTGQCHDVTPIKAQKYRPWKDRLSSVLVLCSPNSRDNGWSSAESCFASDWLLPEAITMNPPVLKP